MQRPPRRKLHFIVRNGGLASVVRPGTVEAQSPISPVVVARVSGRTAMEELQGPNAANGTPFTPLSFLERAATVYGDCPSVVYKDTVYTWSHTLDRCLRLASSLCNLGICPGDVVSVVAPNIPAMYEAHFGVPMSGAVLNTVNLRLDARTISILLRHAESKVVLVDYQSRAVIDEALSLFDHRSRRPVLILIDDHSDGEGVKAAGDLTYEDLIRRGDPAFGWVRPKDEWAPIVLNYTSGTTSAPKGVLHCHRGLFIVALDSLVNWCVPNRPVYLWTLPMFHANGWSFPWGMAAVGGTNICLRKFDASTVYRAIRSHGVTHLCGAPVVLNMLANATDSDRGEENGKPLESPRRPPVQILTAGAPPPAAVLFRTEALGFSVSHGYGLTETGGIVVSCAWKEEWNRYPAGERARLKARQGVRSLCLTAADVVDPATGKSVKRDGKTLGDIVLRGGCIMVGYLKNPEATAKAIRQDGWFYTGDVGVMHPDGYMEIKDRSKDVIISGGENLSSVEVETVLYTHPAVNEAAVVARPDEFWGETPCAFVSLKAGPNPPPSEADIVAYCRERLPRFMVPKTVVFREELPKTSTGKIQKYVLREMALALGQSGAGGGSMRSRI